MNNFQEVVLQSLSCNRFKKVVRHNKMEIFNNLSRDFLENPTEHNAINLVRCLRTHGKNHTTLFIGKFMISLFPDYLDLYDELALCSYFTGAQYDAFDYHTKQLEAKGLSEQHALKLLFNQHFSINDVCDRYIFYNEDLVKKISKRERRSFELLTFSITTCKRFDLFEKTMNSFLNCCDDVDKIDRWFCVDDNSSEVDREKMKRLYPFFDFYFKTKEEKGHPQSMNIIRDKVTTPYLFHMEDDWKFFEKKRYISQCMDVLSANTSIGQCLINRNYAETESDIDVKGGLYYQTSQGTRYYIHEFARNQDELKRWIDKYGNCKSSNYWAHFSFRPSIVKTKILKDLGEFDVTKSHFEMDYAHRYVMRGYVSAFLEGIYCLHTGRLTSEREDTTKLNAYALNDECQFSGKEEQVLQRQRGISSLDNRRIKTFVINLDYRTDRWEKFLSKSEREYELLQYKRFSAVDGKKLKSSCQLQQIFENNDYNMRRGMVGCFMSHVKLYCELIYDDESDAYLLLEDDVDFVKDFEKKYHHLLGQLKDDWSLCFLGHHIRDLTQKDVYYDDEKLPTIQKVNVYQSFVMSLGGTTGYLISKKGAREILDFLDRTGATNGIDTVLQKSADTLSVYYPTPLLISSDCFRGDNQVDSDIQYDYSNLEKTVEARIEDEVEYFKSKDKIVIHVYEYDNVMKYIKKDEIKHPCYYQDDDIENIRKIQEMCIHPWYMISSKCIFVVPSKIKNDVTRYYHRYKKNDKYDVEDALVY